VRVLKGAESAVRDLAFSPDGTAIAAGFEFDGVYLWNLEAASPAPVRLVTEGGFEPGGLHFSADSRSLAWQSISGRREYDRDTREYTDHSFAVTRVTHGAAQSANGSRAVSSHGLPDHYLIGWRFAEGGWVPTWRLSTADLAIESLTLSADGRMFAMISRSALGPQWAANPRRIEVRDAATHSLLGTGDYPYNYRDPLLFSPDNRRLVGFNGMTLLVWPVPELGEPRLVRNDTRKQFTAMAFHASGRYLFATSNDTTVHVFDAATWERAARFTWKIGQLKAVAVSADGTLAAAGGDRGDIVIWDVDL
jgi:WD40 repeat protein